jgi:hypothetical protein
VFASQTVRRPSSIRSWLTRSGVASDRGPDRSRVLDLPRPFLGWHPPRRLPPGGSRELREVTPTLPAPLPVVRLGPKPSSSPSGGDRSFRHLPHLLSVSGLPARRGLPSRSRVEPAKLFRVGKAKNASHCLWITGISCTTRRVRNESRLRPAWRLAAMALPWANPICQAFQRSRHRGCRFVPMCLVRSGARIRRSRI